MASDDEKIELFQQFSLSLDHLLFVWVWVWVWGKGNCGGDKEREGDDVREDQ